MNINLRLVNRLLVRDLKYGFKKNIFKIIWFILFFLFVIFLNASKLNSVNIKDANILFLEVFKGASSISQNSVKDIPILWIMINAFIILIIGDYVKYDFDKNSKYVFARIENKTEYWLSKVIWAIINVVFLNLLLLIILWILSKWPYNFSFATYNDEFQISSKRLFLYTFILYTTTLSVLSILQIEISLISNSIYAYLTVITLIVLSIFIDNNFLPAQQSLLLRHTPFNTKCNLSIFNSLIYNIVMLILLIIIGDWILRKKDIL